jgi:Domain of unknown function (DUF5602)
MKKVILSAMFAAALLLSCKKDHDEKQKIFKGPEQTFQHGKAWTWYETDERDVPVRVAVAINDAAMNNLDTAADESGGHHESMALLKFHPKAGATIFNHVGLGWNPHGHEPEPIYGLPHFDFHFYEVAPEAVAAIPPYETDSSKFKNWPAADYFPATYFNPGGGVPQMGCHWIDVTSPELNGQLFTQTFIYGSYDGKVTFYEPMITSAFIKANPSFERAIPQPAKFQKAGYYPTKMRIAKQDGVTNIILEGFVLQQAQ